MSSINKLSVLALASTVLATPYAGHKHGHAHKHRRATVAPYPYPNANTTGVWGTTGVASSYSQGETVTSTQFQTVYQTVSYAASSSSSAGAVVRPADYASGSQCPADVTVTSTEKVYVTITAGQTPASSESSPVESTAQTSSSAPSAPAYSAPSSSSESSTVYSSSSAPVYSSSSAPVYSTPSSSSVSSSAAAPTSYSSASASSSTAYPVLSTYSAIGHEVGSSTSSAASSYSSTTSAAPSYSSTSSSSGGKRGLAYNSASLLTCFDSSSEISWAYNWVSASAGLTSNFNFVPTLHDGSDTFTSVWNTEASASIASGSTTLFSFNEPDESSQANMSPEAAAQAYIKYMNPFAGKAQLCAPSVTNGGGSMGLTWLQNFVTACAGNCHIDCYSIHWYSPADATAFKEHVTSAIKIAGDKPVWVSEFACNGASDSEVSTFLQEVMPWMDSNASIAGYAYYMASDGSLITGTEPSSFGTIYSTYTG